MRKVEEYIPDNILVGAKANVTSKEVNKYKREHILISCDYKGT